MPVFELRDTEGRPGDARPLNTETVLGFLESVGVLEPRSHEACSWSQVGRCVFCSTHGTRLYQGSLPRDRVDAPMVRSRRRSSAADQMRQAWGKA